MIITDKRTVIDPNFPVKLQCDVCKTTYDLDKFSDDIQEIQEFTKISFRGGYSSIFGDESYVSCDICQHCLKKLLGQFLKITDPYDMRHEIIQTSEQSE